MEMMLRQNWLKIFLFCVWISMCAVVFWSTYRKFKHNPEYYYIHQILGKWLCISRGSADVLNLNCALLVLPMCRDLTMTFRKFGRHVHLRSISHLVDACKGFHILCAYLILALSAVHFLGHIFNAFNFVFRYNDKIPDVNPLSSPEQGAIWIIVGTVPGITGLLMLLILIIIGISSIKCVRRSQFNTFWYIHRLYAVFYILLLFHAYRQQGIPVPPLHLMPHLTFQRGPIKKQINVEEHTPGCNASEPQPEYVREIPSRCNVDPVFESAGCKSWMWIGPSLVIYLFCKLYHFIKRTQKAHIVNFRELPQDVVELNVGCTKFHQIPGQYIYLMVPDISTTEWHPFSISYFDRSSTDSFNVHIKVNGDWTESLRLHLRSLQNSRQEMLEHNEKGYICSIPVHIEGPFISCLGDVSRYPVSVCIAGGIGITPFVSSINQLRSDVPSDKLARLYVIWINRSVSAFIWFRNTFENTHNYLYDKNLPDMLISRFYATSSAVSSEVIKDADVGKYISERLHYGRPVLEDVIGEVVSTYRKFKVGVFVCGHSCLISDVQSTCNKLQMASGGIHFHKESF